MQKPTEKSHLDPTAGAERGAACRDVRLQAGPRAARHVWGVVEARPRRSGPAVRP